jgi:hypothetical protein
LIHRKKTDVDIINDVLEAALQAYPASVFVKSLYNQYHERGGLSKKQLEGLYHKAAKLPDLAPNKLINTILEKYPQHKRVLFFKNKYDNNEVLSVTELGELKKFHTLLIK